MSEKEYQGALTAFRIVRAGYPVFDGNGAARWAARWTGPGRAIIHAAETYALAVLENLVHFNATELPPHLVVCELHIPETVSRQIIRRSAVPTFDVDDAYEACRALGDRWHEGAKTGLLIVPSRLSPHECNILVHPKHADVARIRVSDPSPARLDKRLEGLLGKRRKRP
jgi:RES domain-containing protein